jgi:hypothetical protein
MSSADDLVILEVGRRLLKAVGAHRLKARVRDELAAFLVLGVAIHKGVFFRLPVEALELIGILGIAGLAKHTRETALVEA